MLMPSCASVSNILQATPAWVRMPMPTTETFATLVDVVMFLGWYEDGRMVCIQETSGTVNNVEVALVTPDWAAYRRLLDEEV